MGASAVHESRNVVGCSSIDDIEIERRSNGAVRRSRDAAHHNKFD
jgi:hypothetical protein